MFGLSAGTILSLALAIVKFANYLFEQTRDAALEQVGADREKLKQFYAMDTLSKQLKQVDETYAKMTPEEVRAALEGDFRD